MDNQQPKLLTTRNAVLWLLLLINLILVLCALYLLFRGNKADSVAVEQSRHTPGQQPENRTNLSNKKLLVTGSEPAHKQNSGTQLQPKTDQTVNNNQSSLTENNLTMPEQNTAVPVSSESSMDTKTLKPNQNATAPDTTVPSTHVITVQTTDSEAGQYTDQSTSDAEQTMQFDKIVAKPMTHSTKTSVPDIEQPIKTGNQSVTVTKGDNLWNIAEDIYGSGFEYPRIFNANPDLNNPDIIEIGTVLQIPLKSDRPAQ